MMAEMGGSWANKEPITKGEGGHYVKTAVTANDGLEDRTTKLLAGSYAVS